MDIIDDDDRSSSTNIKLLFGRGRWPSTKQSRPLGWQCDVNGEDQIKEKFQLQPGFSSYLPSRLRSRLPSMPMSTLTTLLIIISSIWKWTGNRLPSRSIIPNGPVVSRQWSPLCWPFSFLNHECCSIWMFFFGFLFVRSDFQSSLENLLSINCYTLHKKRFYLILLASFRLGSWIGENDVINVSK